MRKWDARRTRRVSVAVFASALLLALTPFKAQAQAVGKATNLRVAAQQTPPNARPSNLVRLAPIFRNAQLTTSPTGALEVTFADGSKLSMGANSTVVVDAYVYSTPGGPGEQSVRYTKGAFRFISGTIPKDKVSIETPTVSVGIRGTVVRTFVEDDGTTTVGVDDGVITVTSKQTGQVLTLGAGEKVTIKPGGEFGQVQLGKVEGCN